MGERIPSFTLQENAMRGVRRLSLLMMLFAGQAFAAPPELAYRIVEGQNLNAFVRDGNVAAHLLLRNGVDPRILVAFPAGNSGVGLWFETTAKPVTWRIESDLQPLTIQDAKGRPLYGIKAIVTIDAARLNAKQAVLSNVRFLRDYQAVGKFPAEVATTASIAADTITYARDRIDGAAGYQIALRVLDGRIDGTSIVAGASGRIRLEMTAVSGDPPLTPLTLPELLNANAAADPIARDALHFLSYREKFLAGSWRFNTYFGRDTLMSLRMLMPALQPAAIEAGLNSVLARLNDGGEVSHEEGLSEFAIIDRKNRGVGGGDIATNDYAMVDDDFMLAPVIAHYLLDVAKPDAAKQYLAGSVPSEVRAQTRDAIGPSLVRNLRFVVAQARPYFDKPVPTNLIEIKKGKMQGQWRDSDEGLGRGRYAYDVNAVFVPAALESTRLLLASGLLDPYLDDADRTAFADIGKMAKHWHDKVPPIFETTVPATTAAPAIAAYARDLGVPDKAALASLEGRPLTFYAISLDAEGKQVPIINSDEGFALLFSDLSSADIERIIAAVMKPFPAGLMTDIGMLTANPALVGQVAQKRFAATAYHGVAVWSWQQALMAAGFERQLARKDLPATTREKLVRAQADLWRVINATRTFQSSELWSWAYKDGRYQVVAFGAGKADVDESNAAQLWSTVYLAVKPPTAAKPRRKRR
jgi:hypothetical protein